MFASRKTLEFLEQFKLRNNASSFVNFLLLVKSHNVHCNSVPSAKLDSLARDIFFNGLDDQTLSKAVSAQMPGTINNAFKCIKSLRIGHNELQCNAINPKIANGHINTEVD